MLNHSRSCPCVPLLFKTKLKFTISKCMRQDYPHKGKTCAETCVGHSLYSIIYIRYYGRFKTM